MGQADAFRLIFGNAGGSTHVVGVSSNGVLLMVQAKGPGPVRSDAAAEGGPDPFLSGLSVVVVEDEMMVSLLLEDMLETLGCHDVIHAASVSSALDEIAKAMPDVAVLDVNLGSEMVYPVAEKLNVAGVPFVFTTGYGRGAIKLEWAARPCVQKPFNIDAFASALRAALGAT